jgi:hypothetical protein
MPEARNVPDERCPAVGDVILIADLPPGFFWARPATIGSSQVEARAFERGTVAPDRTLELRAATKLASEHLLSVEPKGRA